MKRITILALMFAVLVFCVADAAAQATADKFVGTWTLDKTKTKMQDLPPKLKNYTLVLAVNEKQINVKNQSEGNVEVAIKSNNTQSAGTNPGGFLNRTDGVNTNSGANWGGTAAIFYSTVETTYDLDKQETVFEINDGKKVNGNVKLRAKIEKEGRALRLTQIRNTRNIKGDVQIIIRERWDLSEDGKTLKFQRLVETGSLRDQVDMVFTKKE